MEVGRESFFLVGVWAYLEDGGEEFLGMISIFSFFGEVAG